MAVSPLAPAETPALPPLRGVRMAVAEVGIRYKNRPDLLLMELAAGTTVAGVLTCSLTASAPVEWCRAALTHQSARALVVNSGNSNAFTGKAGVESVDRVVKKASSLLGCTADEVFVASTGVIGEPLPDNKITDALPALHKALAENKWNEASAAIMTTDTFRKTATRTATIDGKKVILNGMAKGSGMIAPDMATMLAFIATDAAIPSPVLQHMLSETNKTTFNCITVDSDTSTSDTVLLFATGAAKNPVYARADAPELDDFRRALGEVMMELAHLVVRDGEGASKFITITVTGAESGDAARRIGMSIANSPLVKTAIAGEDANWGRIVMAVGKSGERADRDKLAIIIGGVIVAKQGQVAQGYDETPVAAHMKTREITIQVDVGVGRSTATVWTCDLTHGYIDINASYRS